jgi:hypothetical protein
MADPKKYRPLSIDALQTAMPEFNWSPGHSGRRITGPYIRKIRRMWKQYLAMNDDFIVNQTYIDDKITRPFFFEPPERL